MYEESSGVPLLMAGPGVSADTGVTLRFHMWTSTHDRRKLVRELDEIESGLPGDDLVTLARETPAGRGVFSEMHDDGSMTGTFMLRKDDWKLVHYAGHDPQLFCLASDPFEEHDLAGQHRVAAIQQQLLQELRAIVDPEEANRLAISDQQLRIERLGGAEAILARPDFNFTPPPF